MERAASAIEYGGVLALVAAVLSGLLLADIPGRVVEFCESAICQVTRGEDCSECRTTALWPEQVRELPPNTEVVFSGGPPPDHLVGEQPGNSSFDIAPEDGCTMPDRLAYGEDTYEPEYAENFTMLNGEWGEDKCGDKDGDHEISDEEQQELNELVEQAHDSGMTTRFWGAPDGKARSNGKGGYPCPWFVDECQGAPREAAWGAQLEAGVDFYNTNHLTQSSRWLKSCGEDGF